MIAKLKDLDSLKFPEAKRLLKKIAKSLGFRLIHSHIYYYSQVKKFWRLTGEDVGEIIFLNVDTEYADKEYLAHDKSGTAKAFLKRILNSRSFKTIDEKTIQNPFYHLDLSALKLKLDLLGK